MNLDAALAWVRLRSAPASEPKLSEPELAQLVTEHAARPDEDGNAPHTEDWTPTYSLAGCVAAVAEAWALKCAKVAAQFAFSTDGQRFERNQMHAHCASQRDWWHAQRAAASQVG